MRSRSRSASCFASNFDTKPRHVAKFVGLWPRCRPTPSRGHSRRSAGGRGQNRVVVAVAVVVAVVGGGGDCKEDGGCVDETF